MPKVIYSQRKTDVIAALLAISMFADTSIVVADNALPLPPVPGTRMTEAYAMEIGRFAYFWAWPMMNMHNRRTVLGNLPEPGLMGGIVPVSPANQLCMLRDYIEPQERLVACLNQDVVYGFGILAETPEASGNSIAPAKERGYATRSSSFFDFKFGCFVRPWFDVKVGRIWYLC